MRVALGCDHAGFELKRDLATFLLNEGHDVLDLGTDGPEYVDILFTPRPWATLFCLVELSGVCCCVVAASGPLWRRTSCLAFGRRALPRQRLCAPRR